MILIRNDDVLLSSSGKYKGKEFNRFKFIHEQICRVPDKLLHCPAILCQEIQAFPEAIEYIRAETLEGRMRPYLHCWDHTDWTKKSQLEIYEMLQRCDKWFEENLNQGYSVWATPWGADSPAARQASAQIGIRLELTNDTIDLKLAAKITKQSNIVDILDAHTILIHWWERGLSMFRIVESAVSGSWTAAALAKPIWFQ